MHRNYCFRRKQQEACDAALAASIHYIMSLTILNGLFPFEVFSVAFFSFEIFYKFKIKIIVHRKDETSVIKNK